MKAKRMMHAVVICVSVLLGMGNIHAGYISTQKTVEPGNGLRITTVLSHTPIKTTPRWWCFGQMWDAEIVRRSKKR